MFSIIYYKCESNCKKKKNVSNPGSLRSSHKKSFASNSPGIPIYSLCPFYFSLHSFYTSVGISKKSHLPFLYILLRPKFQETINLFEKLEVAGGGGIRDSKVAHNCFWTYYYYEICQNNKLSVTETCHWTITADTSIKGWLPLVSRGELQESLWSQSPADPGQPSPPWLLLPWIVFVAASSRAPTLFGPSSAHRSLILIRSRIVIRNFALLMIFITTTCTLACDRGWIV